MTKLEEVQDVLSNVIGQLKVLPKTTVEGAVYVPATEIEAIVQSLGHAAGLLAPLIEE